MSTDNKSIKSAYESGSDAWQPTVNTAAKDAGDEKAAAADYEAKYDPGGTPNYTTTAATPGTPDTASHPIPNVAVASTFTTPPDFVPVASSGSGSGAAPPSDGNTFNIDLGALRTCEQTCLTATSAVIDAYNTLVGVVKNAMSSPSIFGQIVGTGVYAPMVAGTAEAQSIYTPDYSQELGVNMDQLDQEGRDFAASMNPMMAQELEKIANYTEAMGTFNALLNNTGQMYTDTDASSVFHPPGT
jgi:hypothetical protein